MFQYDFPPKEQWALECSLEELRDICWKGRLHVDYERGLLFLQNLFNDFHQGEKEDFVLHKLIEFQDLKNDSKVVHVKY
jgi:hypothetical protein